MQIQWLERLSLARTRVQFSRTLEQLCPEVPGVQQALFYEYQPANHRLRRNEEDFLVDDATQPGACAMYRESSELEAEVPGRLDAGAPAYSFPVRFYGELVGVLTLVGRAGTNGSFTDHGEELASVAGLIFEQVKNRETADLYLDRSRDLMVNAVEALQKDQGHVGRVSRLVTELGNLLDLSAQAKADLFQAAQFHDVGFLILSHRSPFEAEAAHCQAGSEFLASHRELRHLAELVLDHHERYDGSGFPNQKKGDQVSLEGWALALAEDFDEHLHDSRGDRLTKLSGFFEKKARQHHPDVVDALCGLIDSGRLKEIYPG